MDDLEADELHTHTDQAGQEGHAVVTRAQAKKQEKTQKPLKVISNLGRRYNPREIDYFTAARYEFEQVY